MYNLFIVYDRYENINNLYDSIDWKKEDIKICGQSFSIEDAYSNILKLSPDIAIIDISTNKLSTLNLLETLKRNKNKTKCLIISSFNDLQFMKKTIELNALNYLLKPCKDFDILKEVIIAKNDIAQSKKALKHPIFDNNSSFLKNAMLKEILLGNIGDINGISEIIPFYKINLINAPLVASIIDVDANNSINNKKERKKRISLIKDLLSKNISEFKHWELIEHNDRAIFVICLENEFLYKYLLETFQKLKDFIKDSLGFTVTIAIGSTVNSLNNLYLSYKDAVTALDTKLFYGDDSIISINNILPAHFVSDFYPIDDTIALIESVKAGNILEVRKNLDLFFKSLVKHGTPSKAYIQDSTSRLINNLFKHCISPGNDKLRGSSIKILKPSTIMNCKTINEIKKELLIFLDKIVAENTAIATTNSLIKSAIDYIVKNYSNKNITLELVANEIYITPVYLSKLFKQETGVNFLEFLHKFRIEQSKDYLMNTDIKIYEISSLVGYTSEKHFSKMFKKFVGHSPTDYRQLISH